MRALRLVVAGLLAAMPVVGHAGETVRLFVAGSLREPLTEVARLFEARDGSRVEARFGASGLLRDEIAAKAQADVFASANMEHPRSLAEAGRSDPAVLFARNRLCALVRPGLDATSANVVERMLDPGVKLGTSTPRADPSGDYAWAVFRKVDGLRPGSFEALEKKALQLTGMASEPPPGCRSVYATLIATGKADLFLTYWTGAQAAVQEVPGARAVDLPEPIGVAADYGLTVLNDAPPGAYRLALFMLSPKAQGVLARHGFAAPNLPQRTTP